jgi:DNA invertase Pin-like site-specific DNA recombinase
MVGILGYARVSTHQQDLESQRQRLKQAGSIKLFEDVISGKVFQRPGLDALVEYARPNDLLCVVRLDRPGRSLKELLATVEHLKSKNIGLMSLEEKIDTSSAAGELVFHVFGAIAHFERRLISERTKDGITAARLKGKKPGRPPLDKETLESALSLVEDGKSVTKIAKQMGIGRSTLYRELKYNTIN